MAEPYPALEIGTTPGSFLFYIGKPSIAIFAPQFFSTKINLGIAFKIDPRVHPFAGEEDYTVGVDHPAVGEILWNPEFYDKNKTWTIPIPIPDLYNLTPPDDSGSTVHPPVVIST